MALDGDLRRLAVESFNEHTLAGLAVGLVRDGRLSWFAGLGVADAESGREVDEQTVFRIGSISKTMTALAVMQLVEEGSVGLDDPVNEHLRSFRVSHPDRSSEPVRIRHLLTHTGGLGELRRWSDLVRPTIGLAAKPGRVPELSRYYAPELRAEIPPGTKWAYANHGFAALGQLIEDVTGDPFAVRLRERVFEPLGMQGTDFLRSERVRDRLAVGYKLGRRGLRAVKDLEIAVPPAGSVFSSVADMALYAAAIAGGGANGHGRVIREETLASMLTPAWPSDGLPAMGLAFMLEELDGHRVAGHDGGWPGFVSALLVAPDDGVGVVAFTNTSTAFAPHDVAERVLCRMLGTRAPEEREPVPESPHLWPQLVGLYKLPRGPNTNFRLLPVTAGEIEVAIRGGKLVARSPSPLTALRRGVPLRASDASDPLAFGAEVGGVEFSVVFERGASGRVEAVRAGSTRGEFVRFVRRPRGTSVRLWGIAAATAVGSVALGTVVRKVDRRREG
ncbi:MAG TPA: serine hydrolase domain-containing protein [Gaiellaceae bacterium]